jgi:protein involved in polysaccharide export with SLBB domain
MVSEMATIKPMKIFWVVLLFCTVFAASGLMRQLQAQWRDQQQGSQDLNSDLKKSIQSQAINIPLLSRPLESIIDPEKYIVGPSDVFSVNIWTSPPLAFYLPATPEGTVIIPTVGEVRVADLTLLHAKEVMLNAIRKKYIVGNPTVTLVSPRDFIVTISGDVKVPGRYMMNATERVDRLIQAANAPTQTSPVDKLTSGVPPRGIENPGFKADLASKRNIILRRRSGKTVRVDLQQFFAANNKDRNPFLLEGDEVFVPTIDDPAKGIAVYGAVNAPGRFEFVEGDSILDGITLAYGFTKRSNLDSIELVRFDSTQGLLASIVVKAAQLFPGSPENIPLEPGDRIMARERIDLREDYRVFVDGEVLHPGIYPITRNSTRLSDIIREAGGLTEYASLKSAELQRKTVAVNDAELDRMVRRKSDITPEDNEYVTVEGDTKIRRDNVSVDFEKLLTNKDESQDVVLQTEDRIYIPSVRKTVYVFGQVNSPGNVPYIEGKKFEYYIACAGGYTDDAQKGDAAVIKWTTRQWFDPDKTQIQEGDFIWVPPVVRRPASYWLAIIGQTTSIISVALSIVILVIQLKK